MAGESCIYVHMSVGTGPKGVILQEEFLIEVLERWQVTEQKAVKHFESEACLEGTANYGMPNIYALVPMQRVLEPTVKR